MKNLIIVYLLLMAHIVSAQVQIHTVPGRPKVGEPVSVFLQLETLVTKNEFLIEAKEVFANTDLALQGVSYII